MNRKTFFMVSSVLLLLLLSVAVVTAGGPVGTAFTYQGRLDKNGNPQNGSFDFEAKLFDANTGGNQVGSTIARTTNVIDGLFTLSLDFGNVFTGEARYLEISVRPTGSGVPFDQFPRQLLAPAPYALGLRPGAKIAGNLKDQNTVYVFNLATSGISRGIASETRSTEGRGISGWAAATSGVNYGVTGGSWSTNGRGVAGRAYAASGPAYGVLGESDSSGGAGVFATNYANGVDMIIGGTSNNTPDGVISSDPNYQSSDLVLVTNDRLRIDLDNDGSGEDADFLIVDKDNQVIFDVDEGGNVGIGKASPHAKLDIFHHGAPQLRIGDNLGYWQVWAGGNFVIRQGQNTDRIFINGSNGDVHINGKTVTRVLEITGGSDLSEQFNIQDHDTSLSPEPGLVVCIDAENPGDLVVCSQSYDDTVAGIISGAGGVNPGMVMGQDGSEADGDYPVALTGRVYVQADASASPIQPGDLLTTSDIPGFAMKVGDYEQAQGAILGKAMSSLNEGQGLVLVLVSLQ